LHTAATPTPVRNDGGLDMEASEASTDLVSMLETFDPRNWRKMAIVAQKQLVLKIRFTKGKISENQI
jgi:hypothetical protein